MTTRPLRVLMAAVVMGSLAFSACDEDADQKPGMPDEYAADQRDRARTDAADREPGDLAKPADDLTKPPDNTARNKGDAAADAVTPFDQSEAPADIKITAAIRKSILGMDGMSGNADNVKIMTADGVVAVRGVVESQSEIEAITKIVAETSGVTSSDIQLDVDPD